MSTLLQTNETAPVCILLPSTEYVVQFAAILAALECLASDFPAAREELIHHLMKPGTKVRALPEGNVFVVGERCSINGLDGIFLHYTDKQTSRTHGRRLVPLNQLFRFEPTTRSLPVSRSSIKLSKPKLSGVDGLAGTDSFGNSLLYRTRVVLVGARAQFERALDLVALSGKKTGDSSPAALSASFAWGTFDDAGKPIVISPGGSAGNPLVAVSRDFIDLETPSLGKDVEPGSQLVITDRLDLVLRSMGLANRVGTRQRLLLVTEARKRAEIGPLLQHGWKVWEPQPWELLKPVKIDARPVNIGVPGVDRTQRSAYAELRPSLGYMEKRSAPLSAAYIGLSDLGSLLTGETAEFDERMQESLENITTLFFQVANWLAVPIEETLEAFDSSLQRLKADQGYIGRYLGPKVGEALRAYMSAIELFISDCKGTGLTPKGTALLGVAQNASRHREFNQVFVTGARKSREEADRFFAGQSIPIGCRLVSELTDADDFPSAVVFSVMRRENFARLIDPWPSKNIVFAGYDFEIDVYKQRLRWRAARKRALELSPEGRKSLTAVPTERFSSGTATTSPLPIERPDAERTLEAFDTVARSAEWDWTRRITIPRTVYGEPTQDATIVRFVGRSWMPMTEDHRPLRLLPRGNDRARSGVENVNLIDLQAGIRIIVREGGERDVIRAIAESACGEEKYELLRQRAALWRIALRSGGSEAAQVAKRLADCGINRHIVTVRAWLSNLALIGPRSDDDVMAIAEAFPLPGKGPSDWKACIDAIAELRGLHLSAGMRLTDRLVAQCGRMLFEPADSEIAVRFELGVVWILEVADVDKSSRICPNSIVNRLQWMDHSWRERLFQDSIEAEVA